MGLLATSTTVFMGLVGCTVHGVSSQIKEIQENKLGLAKLQSLPGSFEKFQAEMRTSVVKTDERLDTISEKVAALSPIPDRVNSVATDVGTANKTLTESSAAAREASAKLEKATKEIDAIKAAVAQAQEQLDGLKELPGIIKETRGIVARIGESRTSAPRLSAVVRATLTGGTDLAPKGDFRRVQITLLTDDVPILADSEKIQGLTIDSASIGLRGSAASVHSFVVEPQLDRQKGVLYLTLWYRMDEKPPSLDDGSVYALLNVSWPEEL
jgi:hypothetical protein